MSSPTECKFCHIKVKRASYLPIHQTTTRKCLAIQKELGNDPTTNLLECEFCNKNQTTLNNHNKHMEVCKAKLKKESEMAKKKEKEATRKAQSITNSLEDRFEELASDFRNYKEETEYSIKLNAEHTKALEREIETLKKNGSPTANKTTNSNNKNKKTTNSHNTTNHITIHQVMNPEHVEATFKDSYKLDTLLEGQKGMARFLTHILKSQEEVVYKCTDRSRQRFSLQQEDGTMREDTNCEQLLHLTKPGMDHVSEVYETSLFDRPENVTESDIHDSYKSSSDLGNDCSQFKSELSRIVPSDISDIKDTSVWDKMKSRLQSVQKPVSNEDYVAPVRRPDIGGMSRGILTIFRDRYIKDGTIKYPKALQEKIDAGDTSFQDEYIAFLKEK